MPEALRAAVNDHPPQALVTCIVNGGIVDDLPSQLSVSRITLPFKYNASRSDYAMIRDCDEAGAKASVRAQFNSCANYLRIAMEKATKWKIEMPDFKYSDLDGKAIEGLKKWYSGYIHDSMEALFGPSDRKSEPQDVYHNGSTMRPRAASWSATLPVRCCLYANSTTAAKDRISGTDDDNSVAVLDYDKARVESE